MVRRSSWAFALITLILASLPLTDTAAQEARGRWENPKQIGVNTSASIGAADGLVSLTPYAPGGDAR